MADKDINEEILENIGGKSQNNLNEILRNFTDTDFEVQTFDDSSYIDIDSMTDNLKPHEKSFSLESQYSEYKCKIWQTYNSLILFKWIKFYV